jgi:RNA polymerase sigma-70 factor, ECF subfamily
MPALCQKRVRIDFVSCLQKARQGSAHALGQILRANHGALSSAAHRLMPKPLQAVYGASDLMQDTLLAATRDFQNFRGTTPKQLITWLLVILENERARLLRRFYGTLCRQRDAEIPLDDPHFWVLIHEQLVERGPTPPEQLLNREVQQTMRDILAGLPGRSRFILWVGARRRFSWQQIGHHLGCTAEAARKSYQRECQRCRRSLLARGCEPIAS